MENKQAICNQIYELVEETRAKGEVIQITYEEYKGDEYVTVRFADGNSNLIDVTADSGMAMIIDVLNVIRRYVS